MTQIYVVGMGLDGVSSLLPKHLDVLRQSDILVGSDRLLQIFSDVAVKKWPLGEIGATISQIQDHLKQYPQTKFVILTTGDPLFFGLGRLLLQYFEPQSLTFIPNFCSVQLAFSRLKLPWQDAMFVSVHGRDFDALHRAVRQGKPKIAILTDPVHSPSAIARSILALDLPVAYTAWVCENLGAEQESVQCFELDQLGDRNFASLTVVILLREECSDLPQRVLDRLPLMGIPDQYFASFPDRPGLMTKREVRVLALGELCLQSHQICWDIGAGTGSMSIEMARLLPTGQVYAMEKTAVGVNLIHLNCQRFAVQNITAQQGQAPDGLLNWPPPDRIFIGGSGQHLSAILDACSCALAPKGRVVMAIATLESLQLSLNWLAQHDWQSKILQVNLAKSIPIAQSTRFQPLNPVYLLSSWPAP